VKRKRPSLEDEQQQLSEAAADPRAHLQRIREALASRRSLVAARAARLIKQHSLDGFDADLQAAFRRFLEDPVKSDPSCNAKLAALEALDYGELMDESIFLEAARLVQLEPAWGPPVDTAVGVRSRALMALGRIGWQELDLLAAELLGDKEPPVRQAALEALAHRGARSGAALALFKLRLRDEDPLVTLAAMNTLLQLAPDWGLRELRPLLDGKDEERELAALALGQSRSEAALPLLLGALEGCAMSEQRAPIYRGLGFHRSDGALEKLLEVIGEAPLPDAKQAIAALSVRRYDPGIVDKVRRAANRDALAEAVEENFSA
jgi:HEAT repeat protein